MREAGDEGGDDASKGRGPGTQGPQDERIAGEKQPRGRDGGHDDGGARLREVSFGKMPADAASMAARAPDGPRDPVGQKHRQDGAGPDDGHDGAGSAERQIGHGPTAKQHQVEARDRGNREPRPEAKPLIEP